MLTLSLNNHLKFGRLYDEQYGSKVVAATQIGKCLRAPLPPIDEAVLAAREIYKNASSKIVLCLSGGVDGESMARAFLKAEVPFEVAIAVYDGGLNHLDTDHAFSFCKKNQITIQKIEISTRDFFAAKKHLEFARTYECRSPQLALHLEMLSRIDGLPVLAWNQTEVEYVPKMGAPDLLFPCEPHFSYQRFFIREKREGIPFFFMYSPELITSFWQLETFKKQLLLANDMALGKTAIRHVCTYEAKVAKYREGGFDIQPRDKKRTGFEEVKLRVRDELCSRGWIDERFPDEPFDFFYRKPIEKILPYPSAYIRLFHRDYFPEPELFNRWFGSAL